MGCNMDNINLCKLNFNKLTSSMNYFAYFPTEIEEVMRIILSLLNGSSDNIDILIKDLITTQLPKIKKEKLHIGKYMDDWQFCFCSYNKLNNFTKWIDFLSTSKSIIIKDQNDKEISLEYFKRIVNKNAGKSTLFDHPIKKYININVEEYDYISDDGYWFTKRNFG